ncbi:MAG TPA: hypothetical protein VM368_09385, partial [Flavisolibacter sp.]|nr:hypothetical protein [Flavisolibacter sp.]
IDDDYIEYYYKPTFNYEFSSRQTPNYHPQKIAISEVKKVGKQSFSLAKMVMVAAVVFTLLIITVTLQNAGMSAALKSICIIVSLKVGAFIFYKGWQQSKLPEAKLKGVKVIQKCTRRKQVVVFVSESEGEVTTVFNSIQLRMLQQKFPE